MTRHLFTFGLFTVLACLAPHTVADVQDTHPAAADIAFFESRIRPKLIKHCYECHSTASAEAKGGLLLDSRDGLLKGGESGAVVVPGKPATDRMEQVTQQTDDIKGCLIRNGIVVCADAWAFHHTAGSPEFT